MVAHQQVLVLKVVQGYRGKMTQTWRRWLSFTRTVRKEGTRLPGGMEKKENEKTTHRMGENIVIYVKGLVLKTYKFLQLNNKTNDPI